MKSLVTGKASGPDLLNNKILKELADVIAAPLTDRFNSSLLRATVPEIWKQANVTPVHKKDSKSNVENYRPISLLSSVGKTFERVIYKQIHNFLLENQVITPFQSGFTRGDSAVNQLVDLYNTFSRALDEGKEVRVVFCDISKAFDRVWHRGLIAKLRHYGISGRLLKWFESYLSQRFQRVVIPGGTSEWVEIKAGVPQGSILGPLLFILYINDIVNDIHCGIRLFADDTSLYIVVDTPNNAARLMNTDLEKITIWSNKWLVTFNPAKTESLLLSRKINKPDHPSLYLNDVRIEEVNTHKHLGVYLSQRLDWQNHVEYITDKVSTRLNLLRSLKFTLDRNSLQKIYFTFIRTVLEYADVAWDNCTQQQSDELEKIQLEAARIDTGTTKLISINKLYKEVGWLKLSERRNLHKLYLFFKMQNGQTPLYLSNILPSRTGDVSSYALRNVDNYQQVTARTQTYGNSFLPSTISAWNSLPSSAKTADSLTSFKRLIELETPKIPAYYNTGRRQLQILQTRLRTECSSLNEHLFLRNLVPSPNCTCGVVENNNHYLLTCPKYDNARTDMLTVVQQILSANTLITCDTLFFGINGACNDRNAEIFKTVQKYIEETKRFTP